jgi:putative ABC transport system permease protein
MKTLFSIAWRNLLRNRRRSFIVMVSISLGIFAMIFSMGFMNGMNDQMVVNTISTSLGDIAIHEKGFQDTRKIEYNFMPTAALRRSIYKATDVKSYAPRVKIQGMLMSGESSIGIMIIGIDPLKEKNTTKIYEYTERKNGSSFLLGPNDDSLLISRSMAKRLDARLGDRLVLMVQDINGEMGGVGLTVSGFYSSPVESFDKYVAFTGIRKLQKISGLGENISEIVITLNDINRVDKAKNSIIHLIHNSELEILSWKDMAPNLVSAVKIFNTMMYIFYGIIFVTVVFSVANTLIMAIMERFHEIGVMKSIGTRPSMIFNMVMLEAVNLGLIGLAGGIVLGLMITALLSIHGIDLGFYMESMRTFGTGSIIYPVVKLIDLVMATAIVLTTTILAALYPAIKAARINPIEALNYT